MATRGVGAIDYDEAIDLLRGGPRGIAKWNRRRSTGDISADPDLRELDLRGARLHLADFSRIDLRGADLRDSDLIGADLREANLSGANLRNADLRAANLRGVQLGGA